MASIRSVLIKTCMASIHKEISQLEHWLSNLPNDDVAYTQQSIPSSCASSSTSHDDVQRMLEGIERVSHQLSLQQITLGHITNRIENLENFRDIQIQQKDETSPWLTDAVVDIDANDEEPVIHVIHMDESNHELPVVLNSPQNEVIVPDIHPCDKTLDDVQIKEIIEENKQEVDNSCNSSNSTEIIQSMTHEVTLNNDQITDTVDTESNHQVKHVDEIPPKEEHVQEKEQEEEVVDEEDVQEEEVVDEEEVQEEVAEDDDAGTVFEADGITYYRDEENQVFSVDDEGNLSDMPIGFWKEKTQTIRFYKMK